MRSSMPMARAGVSRGGALAGALAVALSLTGCDVAGRMHTWGESMGQGALQGGGAYLQGEAGQKTLRTVIDSSTAAAVAAYNVRLSPLLDTEMTRLGTRSQGMLSAASDSLAFAIGDKWSVAMQRALRANIEVAGSSAREQQQLFLARLPDDYARFVAPVIAGAVSSTTDTLLEKVARSLDTRMSASTEQLVSRAVAAGVKAGLQAARESNVWQTTVRIAVGAVVAILLLALAWLWRRHNQTTTALDAVASVVMRAGNDDVKQEIKSRATQRKVEPYLHDFLAKRNYL